MNTRLDFIEVFNREKLAGMLKGGMTPEFEQELISVFCDRVQELTAIMKSAAKEGNPAIIESCVHNICGSAQQIGARRIEAVCTGAEQAGVWSGPQAKELTDQLEGELELFIDETLIILQQR